MKMLSSNSSFLDISKSNEDAAFEEWNKVEYWVYIEGYDQKYMISNYGRVLNIKYQGVDNNVRLVPYHLEFNKYVRVNLQDPATKRYKGKLVSVLVATHFLSKLDPSKNVIHHKDFNLMNNHVCNLEWVSRPEVVKIAEKRGTWSSKKCGDGAAKVLGVPVRCVTDGRTFRSCNSACKFYGTYRKMIIRSIETGRPIETSRRKDVNGLMFELVVNS